MNAEEWQRIKALLGAALERRPAERSSFLHQACGSDAALCVELEALLAAYDSDRTASVASDTGASPKSDNSAGKMFGAYRVVREIGAGGMGAVYLAMRADDAFNKRVAIKLVQAGIDTGEILDRFRHERQILASFDHRNIAKLLDGGTTEQGLPYFVMEYVEGTRIDQYCQSHRLEISERIELFREICSAVQYVHQNLVVHRDLKPGNILVTPDGTPKLLDFGIAKLLKPEMFTNPVDATRIEFRLMTPGYASPEQIRGEPVTTASDVYSLGVVLYELLTSRLPYKLKTEAPAELLRAVCDQEPEKLSVVVTRQDGAQQAAQTLTLETIAAERRTLPTKLQKQLRGDLDAIVAKALRKEPQRRYSSVEQLSDDLRRHLEGLPVSAHRGSWSYRADKFVRRNKTAVAAAACIALLLVGGIVTTSWQARIARAERANALQQFNDVRKLTTSFLFEFHTAIQNLPGSTPARQLLVQRALEYLSKLAKQARDDASLQRDVAEAYLKIGDVQGNPYVANLGDTEGAVKSYAQALALSESLTRRNANDADARRYLARSYKSLGEVLPVVGKPTEALANLRKASALMQGMVAADPGNQRLKSELASCYQVLGDLQGHSGVQNLGDAAGALASYNKALDLYRAQVTANPSNREDHLGMAVVEMRVGDLEISRGNLKAGLNRYRNALAVLEKVSASASTDAAALRLVALAYQKIGGANEDTNPKQAFANYAKAATMNEELLKADPNNAQANMNLAITLRYTGDLQAKRGDRIHALTNYKRVLHILEKLSNAEPNNVMSQTRYSEMLIFTADLLARNRDLDEARRLTSHSLAITRQLASREDATPDDLYTYAQNFLTCTPADLREPATALEYAKRSVEKSGSKDSDSLDLLAQAYFENGDTAQAIVTEQKALSLLLSHGGEPGSSPRRQMELRLARFKASRKHI